VAAAVSGDGSTSDISYTCRREVLAPEYTYRLTDDALVWSDGGRENGVAYAKIRAISLYGVPDYKGLCSAVHCALTVPGSGAVVLSSLHQYEDRSARLRPFVEALARRAAAANPDLVIQCGAPLWSCAWSIAALAVCIGMTFYGLGAALIRAGAALNNLLMVAGGIAGAGFNGMLLLNNWPRRCEPAGSDWQAVWQAHARMPARVRVERDGAGS
jgi:hypothetical protein